MLSTESSQDRNNNAQIHRAGYQRRRYRGTEAEGIGINFPRRSAVDGDSATLHKSQHRWALLTPTQPRDPCCKKGARRQSAIWITKRGGMCTSKPYQPKLTDMTKLSSMCWCDGIQFLLARSMLFKLIGRVSLAIISSMPSYAVTGCQRLVMSRILSSAFSVCSLQGQEMEPTLTKTLQKTKNQKWTFQRGRTHSSCQRTY